MYRQIAQSKLALGQLGVELVDHSFMRTSLAGIDVCHVFGTSAANHRLVRYCNEANIPVVMSSVYSGFGDSPTKTMAKTFLSRHVPGFLPELKSIKDALRRVDRIIALNDGEAELLKRHFGVQTHQVIVIPNGVDRQYGAETGAKDASLVLCVGEVWDKKNQLPLIEAARGEAWKLILVGATKSDYARKCIAIANTLENVALTGALPYGSPRLKELYSSAAVFCLPSLSEVQPLVLVEAALSGCSLVAGRTFPVQDFLLPYTARVDATRPVALREAIRNRLFAPLPVPSQAITAPSWHEVGHMILNLYEEVLRSHG